MPKLPNNVLQLLEQARAATKQPKSEEQADAGNYPKGKVNMHGLRISLENPKGTTRSGTADNGKKWSTLMKHDYGYIGGTLGKDGDHVDVFIGPNPESELVFVVNQNNPSTKAFDEHKCMLGFDTEAAAKTGYLASYEDGWTGLGSIVPMHMTLFKTWLDKHSQNKPAKAPVIKKSDVEAFRSQAELTGSRGRARAHGRPEPAGADYDRIMFTDDPDAQINYMAILRQLAADNKDYRLIDRPGGFLTASSREEDLSVHPTAKRDDIRKVWELQEAGVGKEDAWSQVDAGNQPAKAPVIKKGAGSCPGCGRKYPKGEPYPDADTCEICQRYGEPKEKTAIKMAAVDPTQLMKLTRHPLFRQWLYSHGYLQTGQSGGSLYDEVLDVMRGQEQTKAMQLADEADIPTRARALQGMSNLMGVSQGGRGEQFERMARDLSVIAPLMSHIAPDLWSAIHGGRSAGQLAGAIQAAGRDKIRPEVAAASAKSIANAMYDNPGLAQGFSTVDLGEIYGELARRGLASDITTEGVQQSIEQYVPAMRAARDTYGRSMTASELFTAMGSQLNELPPDELAQKIYEQAHYARLGGKSEAVMRDTGITPGFGQKSVAELGQMDRDLLGGAAQSPLAQQLGATIAMDDAGLLPPGSPAQQMAQQIRAGEPTDLARSPGQWLQMMEQSGVGADVATAALRAPNTEPIQKHRLGDMVRGLQRDVDVRPFLESSVGGDSARALMSMPQEAYKDRQSQMAGLQKASPGLSPQQAYQTLSLANTALTQDSRFGGKGLRSTMQMHSPQVQQRRRSLFQQSQTQAKQRMDFGRQFAGQSMGPMQRIGDMLQQAGKPGANMSLGQAAGRVLNLTPTSQIPKLIGVAGS